MTLAGEIQHLQRGTFNNNKVLCKNNGNTQDEEKIKSNRHDQTFRQGTAGQRTKRLSSDLQKNAFCVV